MCRNANVQHGGIGVRRYDALLYRKRPAHLHAFGLALGLGRMLGQRRRGLHQQLGTDFVGLSTCCARSGQFCRGLPTGWQPRPGELQGGLSAGFQPAHADGDGCFNGLLSHARRHGRQVLQQKVLLQAPAHNGNQRWLLFGGLPNHLHPSLIVPGLGCWSLV
jgi:hypothetical protein